MSLLENFQVWNWICFQKPSGFPSLSLTSLYNTWKSQSILLIAFSFAFRTLKPILCDWYGMLQWPDKLSEFLDVMNINLRSPHPSLFLFQAQTIAILVKTLVEKRWPTEEWGEFDPTKVGVITPYRTQVWCHLKNYWTCYKTFLGLSDDTFYSSPFLHAPQFLA